MSVMEGGLGASGCELQTIGRQARWMARFYDPILFPTKGKLCVEPRSRPGNTENHDTE
jgi:hypothetical protein